MIFGKSYEEKYDEKQAKLEKLRGRVKSFAWLPVRENFGKWVWLQAIWVDHGVYGKEGELKRHGKTYYLDGPEKVDKP